MLSRLSKELGSSVRKDLQFILSEFSQGYPWLLKKLCAHVKAQCEAGVLQSEIATSLLNVEELFQDDLKELSAAEEDTLRRLSKAAPVGVQELSEDFDAEVVQSLVNRRLLVRVGHKYDIYWDIFRDYLNTGRLPVQENYILRVQIGSVLKATRLLSEHNVAVEVDEFRKQAGISSEKSFYNIVRDMRLLGLAKIRTGKIELQVSLPRDSAAFSDSLGAILRDRLRRNRFIWRISERLESGDSPSLAALASLLSGWCPYISATSETWHTYARILADWMDFTGLATFRTTDGILDRFARGPIDRSRYNRSGKHRRQTATPLIQYGPIERSAVLLYDSRRVGMVQDWSTFKPTTRTKALSCLEQLGFVRRSGGVVDLLPAGQDFAANSSDRVRLFREAALKIESFRVFVDILDRYQNTGATLQAIAREIRGELRSDWKDGTAETIVKIMLDWARHADLAPGMFRVSSRERAKEKERSRRSQQPTLL